MSEQQTPQQQQKTAQDHITFSDVPVKPGDDTNKLSFTKTFHVDYVDPDTGQRSTGSITVRRLSVSAYAEAGVRRAQLNNGLQVDAVTGFVNEMRAYLSVAITQAPEWWDLDNCYDLALLRATYDYVTAWEGSFRRKAVASRRE